jgi:hypothetical protein
VPELYAVISELLSTKHRSKHRRLQRLSHRQTTALLRCGLRFADPLYVDALRAAATHVDETTYEVYRMLTIVESMRPPTPAIVGAVCDLITAPHVAAADVGDFWHTLMLKAGALVKIMRGSLSTPEALAVEVRVVSVLLSSNR